MLQLLTSIVTKCNQKTTGKTERFCSLIWQGKHTYTVHWLNLVTLKTTLMKKLSIFDLPLEINEIPTKPESQKHSAETYDPNPATRCTQTTDATIKMNFIFGNTVKIFKHQINLFRFVFSNNVKNKKRT